MNNILKFENKKKSQNNIHSFKIHSNYNPSIHK